MPELESRFAVYGPSRSSQFQMGTGRGLSSSVTYTYTLIPRKIGKVTIGAATMVVRGKEYATEPIEIEVVAGGDAGTETREQADLFVRINADRQDVYVNQPIILTFALYTGPTVQIQGNLSYQPPEGEGFFVQKLPEVPISQERVGATRYVVRRVRNAYVPLRSGDLEIGPARVGGNRVVPRQRRSLGRGFDSFFNDPFFNEPFFGTGLFGQTRPFSLETEPISVHVRPLPERDRPASFTGAVGTYDFEVLTPHREATVGDSVALTARVAGHGYIQGVGPPKLSETPEYKLYEPESTLNVKPTMAIGGEKIFTYVLVPQREGLVTIPELAFSYFDPEREHYITERKGPFTLEVAAAPQAAPIAVVDVDGEKGKRTIEVLGEDIFSLMVHVDRFRQSRPFSRAAATVVLGLPPIACAAFVLGVRRRERLRTDTRYVRDRNALRNARRRLMSADRAGREGDRGAFYQDVHRAVTDYLADKLDRPAAGLTVTDAAELLAQVGIDATLVARVTDLLGVCDFGRFGSADHERHERQELLKAAVALLRDIDRELRHSRVPVDGET